MCVLLPPQALWSVRVLATVAASPLLQQPLQSFSKVGLSLHLGAALMLNVLLYFLLTSFVDEQNL